jgi:hypothetical protein
MCACAQCQFTPAQASDPASYWEHVLPDKHFRSDPFVLSQVDDDKFRPNDTGKFGRVTANSHQNGPKRQTRNRENCRRKHL